MEHRIIIIVPFYNAKEFLRECLDSVMMQTYTNWMVICADDGSYDGSSRQIPIDYRIKTIIRENHLTTMENIALTISIFKRDFLDEDILCILDGDDKLLGEDALQTVADIYHSNRHCLMTYGNLEASTGIPIKCNPYSHVEYDELRKKGFRIKQLRTFKWKLYKEFLRQDPEIQAYKDGSGNFFPSAYDVAIFIPLLEIAGYHGFIVNKHPIYWYRRYGRNDDVLDFPEQENTAHQIMAKKPFKMVFEPIGYRITWGFYTWARAVFRWIKKKFEGNLL